MKGNRLKSSLFVKLLAAVAISFLVSFLVMIILSQSILYLYSIEYLSAEEIGVTSYNVIVYSVFAFVILSFIGTFLAIIRKKILYIKRITESINEIANGNLGLTIERKGNDEIGRLAENINTMSIELASKFEYERQLETAKNDLITNISHDLRTPLTSIIGYLDLLRTNKYSNGNQLKEYLETSYANSKRLESLINELFEYSRLSSPDITLELSEVDFSGLLEQLLGEYVPMFEKENLKIVKSIPDQEITVTLDVNKIVRVYENLFINSIKYSTKPSDIHISLKTNDSMTIVELSNRVEAPSIVDTEKLFERFFVGDQARQNNQGTGLGLAIAKRIVELHNGSIRAAYKEGWITFTVEHPITMDQIQPSPPNRKLTQRSDH
ncbi:sensor histidine kinase [Jeotgalibacillus proteolyticus]|uniref:histidine kinase n=1 Tax=Jeotgalibacillus proteolyticus TaxID=2082395 RepID=A0A2S5G8U9_9BACL|nr:HAMP domain-containing sensor histidine kinase [Jeotgalibacillus proteolyticus]PPA69408.1 two-component sensor histidine kinase [Jeotgalibacillus proteolyticus]